MIYCGVKADDPRVKAATKWIEDNYDLKTNPGLGRGRTLLLLSRLRQGPGRHGQRHLTDSKGVKHDWRKELVAELASRQQANGSWMNPRAPAGWKAIRTW